MIRNWRLPFVLLVLGIFVFTACQKEDELDPTSRQYVNGWIEDVMQQAYYWQDELPASTNKNLDPTDYFESLLSNQDRFSRIFPDYQALIDALNGVSLSAGYEFQPLLVSEGSDDVIMLVLYTLPDQPADLAGLKRGDVITHINGAALTTANYSTLYAAMQNTYSVDFRRWNEGTQALEPQPQITLSTRVINENPNYLSNVYTINGEKIGYYVYNFFSAGTEENPNFYDNGMESIIKDFKDKGANHLILDLRYNGGGSVSSSINLASLIGNGVDKSEVYFKYEYNDYIYSLVTSEQGGEENLKGYFRDKVDNIGSQLNNNTIYILVGSGTASASELIINGLKPYMNVVLIGETTVGKNYLESDELYVLHILCEQFLLYAESKAIRGQSMTMDELSAKLDSLLATNEYPVFSGYRDYLKKAAAEHAAKEWKRFQKMLADGSHLPVAKG